MAKQHSKSKCSDIEIKPEQPKPRKLFAECGRPYNLNEPKITFTIEDSDDRFVLNLHIYKYYFAQIRSRSKLQSKFP